MLYPKEKEDIEKIVLDNLILSEKGEAHGARLDIILALLAGYATNTTQPADRNIRLEMYRHAQRVFSNNVYLFK